MFFLKQTQSRLPETSRVSLVWTGHTFSLKAHGTPMTPGPFPWRRGPNGTSSVAWQRRWRVYWIGRQRGQQHPILRSMFSLQFDIQHFFRGHTKKGGPNPKIQRVSAKDLVSKRIYFQTIQMILGEISSIWKARTEVRGAGEPILSEGHWNSRGRSPDWQTGWWMMGWTNVGSSWQTWYKVHTFQSLGWYSATDGSSHEVLEDSWDLWTRTPDAESPWWLAEVRVDSIDISVLEDLWPTKNDAYRSIPMHTAYPECLQVILLRSCSHGDQWLE